MLTIIAGALGSGKTLFLTLQAILSKRPIVSNYRLFGINREELSLVKFLKSEYIDRTILIDEIYTLLDARNSMSNLNKLLSYTLFQSRKKSVDILGTLQLGSTLDYRFRDLTDRYITALGIHAIKGVKYYKYKQIKYKNGKRKIAYGYIPLSIASDLYNYYDTNEVIDIPDKDLTVNQFKTNDEIKTDIKSVVIDISEEYEIDDITHDRVRNYLFMKGFDVRYEPYVYIQARDFLTKQKKVK